MPAKKTMSKMGFWQNIQWKTIDLQSEKSEEIQCATRVLYNENTSSLPSKQRSTKISITRKQYNENAGQLTNFNKTGHSSVTRTVHIEN